MLNLLNHVPRESTHTLSSIAFHPTTMDNPTLLVDMVWFINEDLSNVWIQVERLTIKPQRQPLIGFVLSFMEDMQGPTWHW